MNAGRFEIVRTDADQPFHARLRAANGRIVWTTENYTRRRGAENAIEVLADAISGNEPFVVGWREVDERTRP